MNDVQQSDIGTIIRLTLVHNAQVVDISSATVKEIWLKPKNGTRIDKTATFTTDGKDGKIQCTIAEDDFAIAGELGVQGYIVSPEGVWHSNVKTITVNKNL